MYQTARRHLAILFAIILMPYSVYAQHKGLGFQAVLQDPEGNYPTASGLSVTLQILDPVNNCVLREEVHSGALITDGYLNLVIGSSVVTVPAASNPSPILSIKEVMDNSQSLINGFGCTYTPHSSHGRKLRLKLNIPKSSGGVDLIEADFNMRAVAYAVNSETLNGKSHSDFVNINNSKSVTQENVESIFERFTKLDAILNNSNAAGTALGVNITGNAATSTSATNVTGTVAIANGGTGATTVAAARTNMGLGSLATLSPTGTADATTYLRGDGTWAAVSAGGGTLTSVGMSLPSDVFQVSGSPLTSDGTISSSFKSQNQSYVLAAPNGTSGTPNFRQLLVSDISNAKSAALYDVPLTGDAGLTQVVKGDDSRLENARPPIDNSVTTIKIANGAVTDAKIDTVSGNKITGTVPSGALPVASDTTVGIVNIIAQSFSGLKTFLNGIAVTGNATVSGAISSASLSTTGNVSASGVVSADRIMVANSSATCDGTTEGSLKYNSTSKKMEYCNGTSWTQISQGTQANLSIGAPSTSLVKSGPVTFDVTYGSGTDTATITLAAGNITLGGTATTGCTVAVGNSGDDKKKIVTVDNCTGTGTVNISIAAGTAKSTTGDAAPDAGPSTSYNVDNTGPTAPTGVTLGSVPTNLTNSPTITYTAASDVGGSTVANHQVRIIKTLDSSVVRDWANHTSGSDVGSLTLATNTQYSVLVRAVDALGNLGTPTTAVNWTSINDPCLGSPTPGTACTGGAIFLGSLSPGATSGSGTDKYMTTPGGCGEIPAGQKVGSGASAYPSADFTPTCSGTDALAKYWNDGSSNWYDIPGLVNYSSTTGTGNGSSNTDSNYGSTNTTNIIGITSGAQGGYHAAARYCEKLVYGGYSDWHLPNRYELNLFYTNKSNIPGLDTSGNYYWSSTEYNDANSWVQRFSDGAQNNVYSKNNTFLVRCVRRF